MKYLILLILFVGCSGMSQGTYKKKYHVEDFQTDKTPIMTFDLLVEKMTKCYKQSNYPMYEKTVSKFDDRKQFGTISYEIDNQGLGPRPLVLVEIYSTETGSSVVKLYSDGDAFRTPGVYKHQIQKWLDGKIVDCGSHGKI